MLLPIGSNLPFFRIPWVSLGWGTICALIFFFITRNDLQILSEATEIDFSKTLSFQWAIHPHQDNPLWAYFSYQFVHGSLGHLVSNLWYLIIFGWIVENAFGSVRFLILSLMGGAIAVVPEILVQQDRIAPIVGASGSVAFMMGLTALLFPMAKIRLLFLLIPLPNTPASFFVPIRYLVYFWLLLQVSGLASQMWVDDKPVAYATHLMGFAVGAFLGMMARVLKSVQLKEFQNIDLSGRELKAFYHSIQSFNSKEASDSLNEILKLSDQNPWMTSFQRQLFELGIRYRKKSICDHVLQHLLPALIALRKRKDIEKIHDEYRIAFSEPLPADRSQRIQLQSLRLRA